MRYTAWQLAGDWWWVGKYEARIINGTARYEDAIASNVGRVILRRFKELDNGRFRTVRRYVARHIILELVEIVD